MAQSPGNNNQITNKTTKIQSTMNSINTFEFKALPYAYDALEPSIDKLTLEIHYSKHHKAYYDNFLASIKGTEILPVPHINSSTEPFTSLASSIQKEISKFTFTKMS
jgi:superoxide dismutase